MLLGIIMLAAGITLVLKSNWFYSNFGTIPFFDKYFGSSGGGRLGYKVIGVILCFFGLLGVTGMQGAFIGWLFSPLIKTMTPPGA